MIKRFFIKLRIKKLVKDLQRLVDNCINNKQILDLHEFENIVIPKDFYSNSPSIILYKGMITFIMRKQPWKIAIGLSPNLNNYTWLETKKETSSDNDIGELSIINEVSVPDSIITEMESTILMNKGSYFNEIKTWINASRSSEYGNN